MKLLLALVPAVLLSTAALAQEVPDAAKKDLWCGIAFGIISADVPADASDEDKALAKQYRRRLGDADRAGNRGAPGSRHTTRPLRHLQDRAGGARAHQLGGPADEQDYKYSRIARR